MTDEDARQYRGRIAQLLRSAGFGWLLDEVQAEIAAGKPVEKTILEDPLPRMDIEDLDLTLPRSRRKRRQRRTSTVPFTDQEQLEILLTAIERAVPNRSLTEDATLHTLAQIDTITFQPESIDIDVAIASREPHTLGHDTRLKETEIAARSRENITRLRGMLNDS